MCSRRGGASDDDDESSRTVMSRRPRRCFECSGTCDLNSVDLSGVLTEPN